MPIKWHELQRIEEMRRELGGRVTILFHVDGHYFAYGPDAQHLAQTMGIGLASAEVIIGYKRGRWGKSEAIKKSIVWTMLPTIDKTETENLLRDKLNHASAIIELGN